jgi:hypothetical protein
MARALVDAYAAALPAELPNSAYNLDFHAQVAEKGIIVWPLASAQACTVAAWAMAKCKQLYATQCWSRSRLSPASLMKALPYPPVDFHFWVMYGSWSMCPSCGSWSFNDDYFRQRVYQSQQTSAKPDELAAYRRQVPTAPMEHEYGNIGVSSRWWYLPGMYSPSKRCSCTAPPPCVLDPGERLVRAMRARTEAYEAQGQAAVERTGQLYRIPRIHDDFTATECITWPRYHDGHYRLHQLGESMLDLSSSEAAALQIVVLHCDLKKETYGAPHHYNWKKVGLSRAYFAKELVTESRLIEKGMLDTRCGEPFFIWQPGVSRSRGQIADISGRGNPRSTPDRPWIDTGSTLDRPRIVLDRPRIDQDHHWIDRHLGVPGGAPLDCPREHVFKCYWDNLGSVFWGVPGGSAICPLFSAAVRHSSAIRPLLVR